MFLLMLRCGLRVEEVASLTVGALDLRRGKLLVKSGKGAKDRMVYVSPDAHEALTGYLKQRAQSRSKLVFLVEKGRCRGQPISVRGIQKKMEYYAGESGLKASCHHLRHTMATQLLNADADITVIQDLLGHSRITTTQRYCKVSNRKVERDYYRAIDLVVKELHLHNQHRRRAVCSELLALGLSLWGTQEGQNKRRAKPRRPAPPSFPRLGARGAPQRCPILRAGENNSITEISGSDILSEENGSMSLLEWKNRQIQRI